MKKLLAGMLTFMILMVIVGTYFNKTEETANPSIAEQNAKDEGQLKNVDLKEDSSSTQNYIDPVKVSYEPNVVREGETFTGLPAKEIVEYTVNDPENTRGLNEERVAFSFGVAKNETPSSVSGENQSTFDDWELNAIAWDNKTEEKVLYLAFDCGY